MSSEIPEGCRIELCPGCGAAFYSDFDHKECNNCKRGIKVVGKKAYVINTEKFHKWKGKKIKGTTLHL